RYKRTASGHLTRRADGVAERVDDRGRQRRGRVIRRTDRAGNSEQRNPVLFQRYRKVSALIFNLPAIQLGHNAVEQHLLFSIRADADLTLLVMTLAGPYG